MGTEVIRNRWVSRGALPGFSAKRWKQRHSGSRPSPECRTGGRLPWGGNEASLHVPDLVDLKDSPFGLQEDQIGMIRGVKP